MTRERITDILIFISVFISSITFFKEPFEGYLHYFIFLLYLPFFISRYGFPGRPLRFLLVPLLLGIFHVVLENNTWALFLKIFVGVFLSSLFYYYVLCHYKFDVEKIFRYYLRGVVIVCVIGVVQYVSFLAGFKPGYNYQWLLNKWGAVPGEFGIRVNSVFPEASQMAIFIAPAAFIALYNLMLGHNYGLKKWQSILVLVVTILTTSSTGYIGFFFAVMILMINYGRIGVFFIGLVVMLLGGVLLYNNVEAFKSRVDTSAGLWLEKEFSIKNINSSSFVLYNNYHIAIENFYENGLTGTGLGSHAVAFDRFSLTRRNDIIDIKFNKADGNSMLVRLISETGLIGVFFIFWIIFSRFVRRDVADPEGSNLWLVSGAVLIIIILYLLRQGNYFVNGFPLFVWIYYYTKTRHQEYLSGETVNEEEETDEEETETNENDDEESPVPVH